MPHQTARWRCFPCKVAALRPDAADVLIHCLRAEHEAQNGRTTEGPAALRARALLQVDKARMLGILAFGYEVFISSLRCGDTRYEVLAWGYQGLKS